MYILELVKLLIVCLILISIWFIFLYFVWLGLLVLPFILFGLFIIGFSGWVEQFGFFLWLGSWIISLGKPLTIRFKLLTEKKKKNKMCVCVCVDNLWAKLSVEVVASL